MFHFDTGFHFVKNYHKIIEIKLLHFNENLNSYDSIRLKRLKEIKNNKNIKLINKIKFGDKKFIKLLIEKNLI